MTVFYRYVNKTNSVVNTGVAADIAAYDDLTLTAADEELDALSDGITLDRYVDGKKSNTEVGSVAMISGLQTALTDFENRITALETP